MPSSSWTLAPSAQALLKQVNARWPGRDRTSDGMLGNAAHAASKSDHNPDPRFSNRVHAIDVDEDLQGRTGDYPHFNTGRGCDPLFRFLLDRCRSGKEKRISYLIYEGRIYSRTYGWTEKSYSGVNAHDHHLHVSFRKDLAGDTSSWGINLVGRIVAAVTMTINGKKYPYLRTVTTRGINAARSANNGKVSRHVLYVQRWLSVVGLYKDTLDGIWSPATQKALDDYRRTRMNLSGKDAQGSIGITSLTHLHKTAKATKRIGE